MALTWYSLRLAVEARNQYVCNTERHEGPPWYDATWVEQLLDLETKTAFKIWFTCAECHNKLKTSYEETKD